MNEKKYGKCIEEGRHNYELIGVSDWGSILIFSCKSCEYEHHRRPNKRELAAIKLLNIDDQKTWEYKL